jgi:hypothetical protein
VKAAGRRKLVEESMSRYRVLGVAALVMVVGVATGWAQENPAAAPETTPVPVAGAASSEQEPAQPAPARRIPTSFKSWDEMVADWLTPRPVPKDIIVRIDEKHAFPHPAVSLKMEIVREDETTVWLRGLPPEDPESALHEMWRRRERDELVYQTQREWEQKYGVVDYYLDFGAELVPPPFMDAVRFEPVTSGLPASGLWQMNFAVDDMNGDGTPDLVFPPSRKGVAQPTIFLGRGGGAFEAWKNVVWPGGVPFDYGGIATGDFDADGHRDLVLGIHFKGQYVMYGNGAGNFARVEQLRSPDPRVSSRAPAVADFNGDGRDDVAFLAEIDYDMAASTRIEDSITLWTVLSAPDGWRVMQKGMPQRVIGDSLAAADLDGDGRADLAMASNTNDWRRLVSFNRGDEGWVGPLPRGVLSNAQHPDVAIHFGAAGAELFTTFVQFRIVNGENVARTGVIRYSVTPQGIVDRGVPLFFDDKRFDALFRLGVGDLDGDDRTDVVAGRRDGGLEVYLQMPSGEYYHERSEELESRGRPYDIQLMDLNGDGRDDLIVAFAEEEGDGGGVSVWLSRSSSGK